MATTSRPAALVVGGTAGIGREIARLLITDGHDVSIVGRPAGNGAATAADLGATFLPADVSDLDDVRRLAREFGRRHSALAHLVQCADVLSTRRHISPQGFDVGFTTAYLSRFLLVGLLESHLRAGGAKILHVAAAGAPGRIKAEHVPPPPTMGGFRSHGVAQGANDLFGVELAHRLRASDVRVHVANPGAARTGIRDEVNERFLGRALTTVMGAFMRVREPDDVAEVLLRTADDHPDDVLIGMRGRPVRITRQGQDQALRRTVWERTERAVGITLLPSTSTSFGPV